MVISGGRAAAKKFETNYQYPSIILSGKEHEKFRLHTEKIDSQKDFYTFLLYHFLDGNSLFTQNILIAYTLDYK